VAIDQEKDQGHPDDGQDGRRESLEDEGEQENLRRRTVQPLTADQQVHHQPQ